MLVRAKVTHTEPGTQTYRTEGEKWERDGKLYKHVEKVKESQADNDAEVAGE